MVERELRPERHRTPHFVTGRGGEGPRVIVLHTNVGSFDSTASWFADQRSGVSSHYLVGLDGRLAQFVEEEDTARHAGRILRPTAAVAAEAGTDGVNPFSIGIEFEDGGRPLDALRPAVQYEIGARLIAEIARRWQIPLERSCVIGHRELFAEKECPGNLEIERLLRRARELSRPEGEPASLPLVCLLPARNEAERIAGYLDCAAELEASVIALDDGSTDNTAELLERSPLVARLLRNPTRTGYEGWDDRENRQRLLEAAAELGAEWALFLDADERIEGEDAAELRRFLGSDALPGLAYGLELYRAWEGRVVPDPTHVFRLFACEPGQQLGAERFHFNPVPAAISRRAWVRTTIRARHLDSAGDVQRRQAKYAEIGTPEATGTATAALFEPPPEPLVEWRPRPPGRSVLGTSVGPSPVALEDDGPLLACLVPMRNCSADVDGFLESVSGLADEVIALDDGSTDETAARLAGAPLVSTLLRNPRRETYAGWDDAGNRQQLLDAAVARNARWALFLDADERIDPDDAAALRRFVEREADPEAAYGFRVHRMVGDGRSFDRAGLWVYRLFSPRPGQRLPERTLHLVPVPTDIPRERWRKTTVRIQHFGGADDERRRARLRKYEEADPERRWQSDYASQLLPAGIPQPWRQRPAGLPVPADPLLVGDGTDLEELDPGAPVLSAIVIATDDSATIARSVRAVVEQECPMPFETIVVVSGSPVTAAVVRDAFGEQVKLVELPERVLPGAARNAGVAVARGDYVSFPGSHVEIAPGSLARRMLAHERGWAMVTGSITNGNRTPVGWASYFLDHSSALPGRPSTALDGPPAHCSYVREFLLDAGAFPEHVRAGEDTVVNQELWRRGRRAYRDQGIRLQHSSPCSTLPSLCRHHFVRGRALGRIVRGDFGPRSAGGARARRFLGAYVRRRLRTTDERLAEWGGDLRPTYRRVRPLVVAGILAAAAGTWFELVFGRSATDGEQPRDRRRLEPPLRQPGDDAIDRGERDAAAGIVQQDDRTSPH